MQVDDKTVGHDFKTLQMFLYSLEALYVASIFPLGYAKS